jgi:hypothetical protein
MENLNRGVALACRDWHGRALGKFCCDFTALEMRSDEEPYTSIANLTV